MSSHAIGVDLGGTKILTALISETGDIVYRHRIPTPQMGPESVVSVIRDSITTVLAEAGLAKEEVAGVGVGAPGPLDPRSGVVFEAPNLVGWRNVPLRDLLAAQLRSTQASAALPIFVEHDANAAALAEWWIGAGRGVKDLIYITVSTGIGGGIIIGGKMVHGVTGAAGEIGHMTIDINGPLCHCGNRGCLEVLASGPAIARVAREEIAAGRPTTMLETAGGKPEAITGETVDRAARTGDALAGEIFDRAGTYLGVGVANLINLLNPARIIIGGGVSKAGDLLFAPVKRTVRERALKRPATDAQIVPAALGDDAGVVGAGAVVFLRTTGLTQLQKTGLGD